jgi:carboxypeptidase PM20D1
MPPPRTAVGVLAEGIVRLQNSPLPGGLDGVTAEMFEALGPHMPFGARLAFANRWLFGGLLNKVLARVPASNAMMRTTTAPTMLSGSIKENVLPIEAIATVNFRLHPRDSPADVIAHVERVVSGLDIEVRTGHASPASEVSSTQSEGWNAIVRSIRQTQDPAIVAPGLTVAGTDTTHYGAVAEDSYRFNPMLVGPDDITGFHGTNERISIENLERATRFYFQLLKNSAG